MPTDRQLEFLGLDFDLISEDALVERMKSVSAGGDYQTLVTPNVDHMVRLHRGDERAKKMHELYSGADICVCDSQILTRLAKMNGHELPVVPGSSLVARLFAEVLQPGDRVCIIGGDDDTASEIARDWPAIEIVQHQPPFGLANKPDAIEEAASFLAKSGARFHLIAVGSPQQEMVAEKAREMDSAGGVAMCIGAGVEFLVGKKRRAPEWMQRNGLEWAFRLASEPTRLWRRYLIDGPKIFGIAWRWSRNRNVATER